MRNILLGAGVFLEFALAAPEASAIGGGPAPPWTSPYAILEPQTVAPLGQMVAPQAAEEGRAAFEGRRANCPPGDRDCLRLMKREHAPSDRQ